METKLLAKSAPSSPEEICHICNKTVDDNTAVCCAECDDSTVTSTWVHYQCAGYKEMPGEKDPDYICASCTTRLASKPKKSKKDDDSVASPGSISEGDDDDDDFDASSESDSGKKKKKASPKKASPKSVAKKSVTSSSSKPIISSSIKPAAVSKPKSAPKKRKVLDDDDDDDSIEFVEKENKSNNKKSSPPAKVAKVSQPKSSPKDTKTSTAPTKSSSMAPSASTSSGGAAEVDITKGDNIATEAAAKKLILMYFKQQNRPYSAIQIDDNLHKRISKSMVEKALLSLSEPGQGLIRKEYGKTSIFFPDQSLIADVSPHELDQMDRDIAKLKAEYDKSFQYEKQLKQTLNQLLSEPADSDLDGAIVKLTASIKELEQKVALFSKNPVAPDALLKVTTLANFARKNWKLLKENVLEVCDVILENSNKKLKVLLADMGVETDEDVGQTLPPLLPDVKM